MTCIAMVSGKGGVGKTTLAASVSAALCRSDGRQQRVMAVDLDPQNALSLHLGMPAQESRGLAAQWADVYNSAYFYRSQYGVDCLPYGWADAGERRRFDEALEADPRWLARYIATTPHTHTVIDTPGGATVYLKQAVAAADYLFVVLLADAASLASVPLLKRALDETFAAGGNVPQLVWVINQYDALTPLCRRIASMLPDLVSGKQFVVRLDYAVQEAMAAGRPIGAHAPGSVVADNIADLCAWVEGRDYRGRVSGY